MTFRKKIQYLVVKKLKISNKEAIALIGDGKIKVNGIACSENIITAETDEIQFENTVIQKGKKYIYIAFYKPKGIETTLNGSINDNLKDIIPFNWDVFPVGRLDKDSEGLLLLTNNGKIFDKILKKENAIEKEYIVTTNKHIDTNFLQRMEVGVEILTKMTLPCFIEKINDFQFRIILTQGLNRQIRRMCYKLGYEVIKLVRTRIGSIELKELKPFEYRFVDMN